MSYARQAGMRSEWRRASCNNDFPCVALASHSSRCAVLEFLSRADATQIESQERAISMTRAVRLALSCSNSAAAARRTEQTRSVSNAKVLLNETRHNNFVSFPCRSNNRFFANMSCFCRAPYPTLRLAELLIQIIAKAIFQKSSSGSAEVPRRHGHRRTKAGKLLRLFFHCARRKLSAAAFCTSGPLPCARHLLMDLPSSNQPCIRVRSIQRAS